MVVLSDYFIFYSYISFWTLNITSLSIMSSTCIQCSKPLGNKSIIACGLCSGLFHVDCTGMGSTEIRASELKAGKKLMYSCADCRSFGGDSDLRTAMSSLQEDVSSLKSQLGVITQLLEDVKSLKSQSGRQEQSIAQLDSRVCLVEEGVKAVSDKMGDLQAVTPAVDSDKLLETVSHEVVERTSRACNLIIYGVIPSDSGVKDSELVVQMLRNIVNLSSTSPVCQRFGSCINGKPKPLKVTLSSPGVVLQILKSKNRLPKGIFVTNDKTPSQKPYLLKLSKEKDEHNKRYPENPMIIKYVKGVPKLIFSSDNVSESSSSNSGVPHPKQA